MQAELVVSAETILSERKLLLATTEALTDAVLIVDESERVVHVNQPACELFGLAPVGVQGRSLADVELPGAVRGSWLAFLASHEERHRRQTSPSVGGESLEPELQLVRACSPFGSPLRSVLVVRRLDRVGS
ncbi:MAG: PAS domain-containing protein [Acidobacteriota bacterium]|nr:MAG: PAS domain-containing protein [Acidobacteriota bacterium]